MVVYDKTYALAANQGSSARASNQYIILHETGNANNVGTNSAANEASYMRNNWRAAYTHAIAGWDKVYIIGEPGYVAYGAGSPANERSPFQIEVARYSDRNLALKAYANWINAAREYAAKFGIPLTLDGAGNGVKTHKWVSDNLWGDHQDPYAYLQSIGISKAQLANDIAHGIGSTAKPSAPAKKPVATIATEVIAGKWGNEPSRSAKLKAAGYDPTAVQKTVNALLKVPNKPVVAAPKPKQTRTGWIKQSGTFTITTASGIWLRKGISTNSAKIALLKKGNMVKYDAFCYSGGLVWVRQPRGNSYGYLATGEAKGNKRTSYWGTFK